MNHAEHQMQCQFVDYVRLRWPVLEYGLLAIPNGGERPTKKRRDKRTGRLVKYCPEGRRLQREGALKGVWDMIVVIPPVWNSSANRVHGLIMETKQPKYRTQKNGGLTPAQLEWGAYMNGLGWMSFVMYDVQEGIDMMADYMEGEGITID